MMYITKLSNGLLLLGIVLMLISCSREFKNNELEYGGNVQGFFKAAGTDGTMSTFDVLTIESIIEDWDGEGDFSPSSGEHKLIKVTLMGSTTSSEDLGINEQNLELYNATTKTITPALLDINVGSTFPALDKGNVLGYAVYEVPITTNLDDLYIGLHRSEGTSIETHDWSKEDVKLLLPLKKSAYDGAEKVVELNKEFIFNDIIFESKVKYAFKALVYDVDDAATKAYDNILDKMLVRLDVTLTSIDNGRREKASIEEPYLISQYKVVAKESSLSETPEEIGAGETIEASYYFELDPGVSVVAISNGYRPSADYFVEIEEK